MIQGKRVHKSIWLGSGTLAPFQKSKSVPFLSVVGHRRTCSLGRCLLLGGFTGEHVHPYSFFFPQYSKAWGSLRERSPWGKPLAARFITGGVHSSISRTPKTVIRGIGKVGISAWEKNYVYSEYRPSPVFFTENGSRDCVRINDLRSGHSKAWMI